MLPRRRELYEACAVIVARASEHARAVARCAAFSRERAFTSVRRSSARGQRMLARDHVVRMSSTSRGGVVSTSP